MNNIQNDYSRGSEWRKWDLHIHTPASFFWKGGKRLLEMTDAEKEKELKKFIKKIEDLDVCVFGIMDYWTFDWYSLLKKYISSNSLTLTKTVLPGMELRVECPVDYRLNIQFILSDKLTDQQLIDFKSSLKIRIGKDSKKLSNEALIEFSKTLDKSKAKVHGYEDPDSLNTAQLLELGSKTAEVTKDSLKEALNQIPKEFGYIILPYDTSDGLLNLDWKKHPQADNYFMQTANIFESRDDRNIDLFNGIENNNNKDFFINFFKTIGNSSKPCISGSDAHRYEEYGQYPSNKITWIKSDPTFEGLRQIIYEPTNRAKIQELKPEQKSDYQIIDRVEYENNNGQKKIVYFNQNLNSIIGSRAMGKSNLIKNIACAVDNKQCIEKLHKPFLNLAKFKLYWMDKSTNSINENELKEKGILFIPQGYLGELVYERESRFDKFLSDLFKNKVDFKKLIDEYQAFENQNATQISTTIRELLTLKQTIEETKNKLIRLGKKSDIESEILKTENEIKSKNINKLVITQKELDVYKKLKEDRFIKNQARLLIEKDLSSFELLKKEEVITSDVILNFEFSEKYLKIIINNLKNENTKFKKNFIENEITILKKDQKEIMEKIQALDIQIDPLKQKLNKHKALLDLTQLLQDKKETHQEVLDLLNNVKNLSEVYEIKIQGLVKLNMYFNDKYKNFNFNMKNLEFSNFNLVIDFDKNNLIDFLEQNINYHNSIDFKGDANKSNQNSNKLLNNPINWEFEEKEFKEILKQLLESILNKVLLIKSGKNTEIVLQELFSNRFKINFSKSITNKNGEAFNNMSDGEKMIVILELIFKLDNYNYPVLLDQPEDDLDVKAISKHIVDFLISEKTKRQIIVVSHNSNLVVCADSEEVIEANKSKGKNPNFEYKSGSIENELMRKAIIDVLEGGEEALKKRKNKLNIKT